MPPMQQIPATQIPKPGQPHVCPHPSETPHFGQSEVHPHSPAVPPPPQVCPCRHDPQSILPAQPSDTGPQFLPVHAAAIVFGVQPHTFEVPGFPPPQV